jgi:hypothetical protein
MGVTSAQLRKLLFDTTNSAVNVQTLTDDPEKFHARYFAGNLTVLVQLDDSEGVEGAIIKEGVIYYQGANLARYPDYEKQIQELLKSKNIEWGTPNHEFPSKIKLRAYWPDNNRERAFFMARFKGDFGELEEKARAIYDAGNRLLEKIGEK